MKKPLASLSEETKSMIQAVAQWKATPEPLRMFKSLTALAQAHGWSPSQVYRIHDTAHVYQELLGLIAGDALDQAPQILQALADRAKAGHVRAAEVYLGFVRQTITDQSFLTVAQQRNPEKLIVHTLQLAEQMLEIAKTVQSKETYDLLRQPVEADAVVSSQADVLLS